MNAEDVELAQFRLAAANNALTTARRLGDLLQIQQINEEIERIRQEIEQLKAAGQVVLSSNDLAADVLSAGYGDEVQAQDPEQPPEG